MIKDKPILFSGAMVRAILAGRKTQTRRVLKDVIPPAPAMDAIHPNNTAKHPAPYLDSYCGDRKTAENPRGMSRRWCWWTRDDRQGLPTFGVRWVPGDRLWVRETYARIDNLEFGEASHYEYRADTDGKCMPGEWPECERGNPDAPRWRPSIFMPRVASRITLEVTEVRIERLNDISGKDCSAEGINHLEYSGAGQAMEQWLVNEYAKLWDSINGAGSWDANPFVVALTFRRVSP